MEFHLMIVDDEAPIRKGLSRFIDWTCINCIVDATACDGTEAIEKLSVYPIDIIITDIKMPEADGIALAKYAYEHYPECAVIILTGYADFQYAQTAIQYNVVDFLLKPTSKDQLIKSVQNAQQKILTSKEKNSMAEEEISFLREQLLQELTRNSKNLSLQVKLPHYQLYLDSYYLVAFQLLFEDDDLSILKDIISKQKHPGCCYKYNHLVLAIYYEQEENFAALSTICSEMLEFSSLLYAIDISAGVSGYHTNACELSSAAAEAIYALSLNFYSTENVAYYSAKNNLTPYILTAEDTLSLYQVENCLNIWKFEDADLQITSMFTRLTANFAKSTDIKSICSQLYYICSRVLMKKELSFPSTNYLEQIHHASSILQLEELTHELLQNLKKQLTFHGKKYSAIIENSIQYLHQNLAAPLSLETIARWIHVNPSHLSRSFKKETGISITEYINKARIEKAKELLSNPSALTYEIAELVGFHDPAYFSSTFKKYTGVSPKEYRHQ